MGLMVNPPVINISWLYWRYAGLLGFPIAVIFYRRLLEHRRDPKETPIDFGIRWRLVFLNGFVAALMLAEGCFCVWQIIGNG